MPWGRESIDGAEGIYVVAAWLVFSGALLLIEGIVWILPQNSSGFVAISYGALLVAIGFALAMHFRLAWLGALILQLILLGSYVYQALSTPLEYMLSGFITNFLSLVIGAVVIVYLLKRSTRETFFS